MNYTKNKALIIIICLFFISIVGFVFYYTSVISGRKKLASEERQRVMIGEEKLQKSLADYEASRQAALTKDLEKCFKIEKQNEKEGCISSIAQRANKEEYCDKIETEAVEKSCHTAFVYQKILKQGDARQCLSLDMDSVKNSCLDYFYRGFKEVKECEIFTSQDKIRCSDIVTRNLAYNKNDADGCNPISDSTLKADCKSVINNRPKDSDNDGLSDSLEKSYGTDLFKADTDGDRLTDGEEMEKYGTNPKNPDTNGDGINDGAAVERGLIKAN